MAARGNRAFWTSPSLCVNMIALKAGKERYMRDFRFSHVFTAFSCKTEVRQYHGTVIVPYTNTMHFEIFVIKVFTWHAKVLQIMLWYYGGVNQSFGVHFDYIQWVPYSLSWCMIMCICVCVCVCVCMHSILEWFLKDHVKLKTGVMIVENSALHHRNKLHFKIYY